MSLRLKNFLTRGKKFIVFQGGIYRLDEALTLEARGRIKDAGLANLAYGDVFRRVTHPKTKSKSLPSDIAILVQGFGRFGNMVIQLANLALLATKLGISRFYFWDNVHLDKADLAVLPGAQLIRAGLLRQLTQVSEPVIFRNRAFAGPFFPRELSKAQSQYVQRAIAKRVLSESELPLEPRKKKIVIHLRSGDIFWPQPHPDYGQPPLSFYKKVLAYQDWDYVVLIAEDDTNPCFRPIIDHCRSLGLPFSVKGKYFREALVEISQSQFLVFSAGTFCPAICWLAPKDRTIFRFGNSIPEPFPLRNATYLDVLDSYGEYIARVMSSNWENSREQRELMLFYSELHLDGPARRDPSN